MKHERSSPQPYLAALRCPDMKLHFAQAGTGLSSLLLRADMLDLRSAHGLEGCE